MANTPSHTIRELVTVKTFLLIAGLCLLGWVVYLLRDIVVLLLLSCLTAAALYPAVAKVSRRYLISKQHTILVFYLLLIGLGAAMLLLMANILMDEGRQFLSHFPNYVDAAGRFAKQFPILDSGIAWLSDVSRWVGAALSRAVGLVFSAFDYLKLAFGSVFGLITLLIFTYFLLTDAAYFESALLRLIPEPRKAQTQRVVRTIAQKAGTYIRGQLLVMSGVGILTGIGLAILGVPYALILGLLTFLLDIIPIVGPLIASVVGVLVALAQDPALAVWTLLVYFAAQQIESYVLSPLILGRSLGLHPFWILLSLLVGGSLLGVAGVILAVPTATTIQLLVDEFYVKEFLGVEDNASALTEALPSPPGDPA